MVNVGRKGACHFGFCLRKEVDDPRKLILGGISICTAPSNLFAWELKRRNGLIFNEHLLCTRYHLFSNSHNNPIKLRLSLPPPFFLFNRVNRISSWVKCLSLHRWEIVDLGLTFGSVILKPRLVFRIRWMESQWTQTSISGYWML